MLADFTNQNNIVKIYKNIVFHPHFTNNFYVLSINIISYKVMLTQN